MLDVKQQKGRMSPLVGAAIVALSSATFSGCDRASELQPAKSLETLSERRPVFLRLPDDSLLCVLQNGEDLFFFKNAPGYGESGSGVSAIVLDGSRDYNSAGLYKEIGQLEALAHVDNDWRRIFAAVELQSGQATNSVDPQLVEKTLKPLVTPQVYQDQNGITVFNRVLPGRTMAMRDAGKEFLTGASGGFFPVCVRLPDGGMLAVCEHREGMDLDGGARWVTGSQTHIRFFRNWSQYGVEGHKVAVFGVGLSREYPVLGECYELTPQEVLGYFDGHWEPVYEAVRRQFFIVESTPHPDAVKNALLGGPGYQGTSASLPLPQIPQDWSK